MTEQESDTFEGEGQGEISLKTDIYGTMVLDHT